MNNIICKNENCPSYRYNITKNNCLLLTTLCPKEFERQITELERINDIQKNTLKALEVCLGRKYEQ